MEALLDFLRGGEEVVLLEPGEYRIHVAGHPVEIGVDFPGISPHEPRLFVRSKSFKSCFWPKITDLGYQTETVAVGGRNVINVTLLEGNLVQNDGY